MLTYPATVAEAEFVRDERAAYRPYRATVARIQELSPSFRRVTFTGPDMHYFAPHGLDQRIKLVFPVDGRIGDLGLDDESALVEGSWYARWRELPDAARNPFRTYTVRAVRPADRELDVDFVAHGDGGPAAQWLQSAAVGDELVIVGPDARSLSSAMGMDWHPGSARDVLLAGDETAAPAICSILESLPAGIRAAAFIEVSTARDILSVSSSADVALTWVTRSDGQRLEAAVRAWAAESDAYAPVIAPTRQVLADIDVDVELLWDSPEESAGQFYAWVAGESAMVKSLRRFLVSELGVDRKRVAFMGYWRLGKSEAQG
jgi:NADPH-dependent ferric siderophore reductase